jgi:hypothetical protein
MYSGKIVVPPGGGGIVEIDITEFLESTRGYSEHENYDFII